GSGVSDVLLGPAASRSPSGETPETWESSASNADAELRFEESPQAAAHRARPSKVAIMVGRNIASPVALVQLCRSAFGAANANLPTTRLTRQAAAGAGPGEPRSRLCSCARLPLPRTRFVLPANGTSSYRS